jgi:hypothetical protein
VPLEFLFSGTVFYAGEGGGCRCPDLLGERGGVPVAGPVVEGDDGALFPQQRLRPLRRDAFDELSTTRCAMGSDLGGAVESLLRASEQEVGR